MTSKADLPYNPGKGIVLRFPEFEGFGEEGIQCLPNDRVQQQRLLYNSVGSKQGHIRGWIYPNEDIPEEAYDMVWQALYAWQEVVKDVTGIRFERGKERKQCRSDCSMGGSDVSNSHCRLSVDTKTGLNEWAEIEMTMIQEPGLVLPIPPRSWTL